MAQIHQRQSSQKEREQQSTTRLSSFLHYTLDEGKYEEKIGRKDKEDLIEARSFLHATMA